MGGFINKSAQDPGIASFYSYWNKIEAEIGIYRFIISL